MFLVVEECLWESLSIVHQRTSGEDELVVLHFINVPPWVAENHLCRNSSVTYTSHTLSPQFYQIVRNIFTF